MTVALDTLFVTQYYRPELIGSGPFCADLAEWLAAHGHRVRVLTSEPHYPAGTVFADYANGERRHETMAGVAVERLPARRVRKDGAIGRLVSELQFLMRGGVTLAGAGTGRAGLVLSLCPSILTCLLADRAKRRGGRHVVLVHDIQSGLAEGLGLIAGKGLPAALRRLERFALNRADLVVVLSDTMRDRLRGCGVTSRIEVFPIWVDTDAIYPMPTTERPDPAVVYSGNFGRKQGLGQILDMAQILLDRRPAIPLILRGAGNQAARVADEVRERRLSNVTLAPLLPVERLNAGLADGDVHLVPQDPEAADFAVPSKIFNIMSAGRPFVATARPDSVLWHMQRESQAFLCVPPHDAASFADAVIHLADGAEARAAMGAAGRKYVLAKHSKQRVLRALTAAATAYG